MFAKTTFTLLFVALASIQAVFALDAKIGSEGPAANRQKILDGLAVANAKLTAMTAVLNSAKPLAHPGIIAGFGAKANIAEIKTKVALIAAGKIFVVDSHPDPKASQGATDISTKPPLITFGSNFYDKITTIPGAAGTIIHEASHALAGTVDYFDPNGNPYLQGTAVPKDKVAAGVLVGYKDSNLNDLIKKASQNMHHNADSYRVFADHV